ncbi:MAG: hydrogenase expression/formation protein HypE [Planctomycetota bacterium]|jgi:hydrogenase expression/formation protein HypE
MTVLTPSKPAVNPHRTRIVLAHGGGGQLTDDLLREVVRPRFSNPYLDALDDSAVLPVSDGRMVFTTDSYVVQPLEFPGGNIGRLAVSGTVNDLAVCGAVPAFISLGLILEEGLETATLERVLDAAAATAEEAGVSIVTGDTKVVARGEADGMYVNTAGIGFRRPEIDLHPSRIEPGDVLIVSGTIADHGLAIMLQREAKTVIRSELESDAAPLASLIGRLLDEVDDVVFMRDPTRGGFAGVASDLAAESGLRLVIDELEIPVRQETRYAAEMLGLDPLSVANEGKVMIVVRPSAAKRALEVLRANPLGRSAAVIGRFESDRDGVCEIVTDVGGRRIIQKPYGEELPRIC